MQFKTLEGKEVVVALEKEDKYLVYRYGTSNNIEFEYPESGLFCVDILMQPDLPKTSK